MRRKDREIFDLSRIEDIIARAQVCHVGMCDKGVPYVAPVSFGYRNRQLFLHSAAEGRKLDVIRANPRVCVEFEVDVQVVKSGAPCAWGMHYQSAIGFGTAIFVDDPQAKCAALTTIIDHYGETDRHLDKAAVDKTIVIRVDLESLTCKQCGY